MKSFRARITLWNAVVIALVLSAFGYLLIQLVSSNIRTSIDRELENRARPFLLPPPGFGGAGGPGEPAAGPLGRAGAGGGQGVEAGQGQAAPGAPGGPPFRQAQGQGRGQGPLGGPRALRNEFRPRVIMPNGTVEREPEGTRPYDRAAFERAMRGAPLYSTVQQDSLRLRVFSAPRRDGGRVIGVVQVARPINDILLMEANMTRTLLMLIPVALVVAALGGMFLSSRVLKPVQEVTAAAESISDSDLSKRLKVTGDDELARMSGTFNAMLDRLQGAFQSREEAYAKLKEAFEQQRRFTSDASHELRTPLARIKLATSAALSQQQSPEEFKQALTIADAEADTMDRLINQLLELARADAGALSLQTQTVPVSQVLQDIREVAKRFGRPIDVQAEAEGSIAADRESLKRVFDNLLQNAVRHTPEGKPITVSAEAGAAEVRFVIRDEGEGIPPEALGHVFERFYRADSSRTRESGGTGLGLSIAQSIVAAHHASIEIDSAPGAGTTVSITFPRTS